MKVFSQKRKTLNAFLLGLLSLTTVACSDLPVQPSATGTPAFVPTNTPLSQPTTTSQAPTAVLPTAALPTGQPTTLAQNMPTGSPRSAHSTGTPQASGTGTPVFDPLTMDCLAGTPSPSVIPEQGSPTATIISADERRQVFEDVWNTVNDNYLYPDFNGINWNAQKAKYEPLALAAKCSDQYYDLIDEMITDLGDQHSRYESPADAQAEDQAVSGTENYAGIGVLNQIVEDKNALLVIYVFPGSPADKAGLKRRDLILGMNGQNWTDIQRQRLELRGLPGTTVTPIVQSPGAQPRNVAIVRAQVSGKVYPTLERLSADPTIAYLVIETFDQDDMDTLVENSLKQLLADGKPLNGIIIDVRGNGGGLISVMENLVGEFMIGKAGSFQSHGQSMDFNPPKGALYNQLKNVPLVVLVDKDTVSAAEMFSGALQGRGRAKIVGVTSAGNTETIVPYDMQDGSRLWVAEEGFHLLNGSMLEGKGVVPDAEIKVDWENYSEAQDPHILKAIDILHGK